MATKRAFTTAESVSIWMAYDCVCMWCATPIENLRSLTIDHILPERLKDKPDEFAAIRKQLRLAETFQLDDFPNWVPSHLRCNQQKGAAVFDASPAMIAILARANRLGTKARSTHDRLIKTRELSVLIGRLDSHLQKSAPTVLEIEVLRQILAKAEAAGPPEAQLMVDRKRWRVIAISPWGIATVTDGICTGETPIRDSHAARLDHWKCLNCESFGPFEDVSHCLNCGK